MRLIVVRHGETEWNVAGRPMGHLDSPLTPRGIAQGEALAGRLRSERIDLLYTSDLGRAAQTARILGAAIGREATPRRELRERDLGILQGLTDAEREARYPDETASLKGGDPDYVLPEGESERQTTERTVKLLDEVAVMHPRATVIAVTHSGPLRGFFEHVLGLGSESKSRFARPNAAYNSFLHEDGNWLLETWGDVTHFERRTNDESSP